MALKIQLRGGTAAEWTSANPVLMSREMGVETDTLKVKLGNGTTAWNSLPYFTQGAKGDTGPQGIQGETGATGAKGDTGDTGPANVITMGTVTTGAAGSSASATITGTAPNQTLNLVIPQGMKGDTGTAATITVGTVTALSAGSTPTVTNVGSSGAAVFDFGIPNAVGVPTGGSTGQVLTKTSSATEWSDPAPTTLAGQSDVSITSPQTDQVLARASDGKWKNTTLDISATKVQETSPATPKDGAGWMYSPDGTLFLWNGAAWIQPSAPVAAQVEQRYYSPNYVINGGFDIWQRGTSKAMATGSGTGYLADRWTAARAAYAAGGTVSRQSAGLTGFQYCARIQRDSGNTSTATTWYFQTLETATSLPLVGKTATLSFYARAGANYSAASSALTAQILSGTSTDGQNFPDGAITGQATVASSAVTLSTSWQRFTITGPVSSSASQLFVGFTFVPVGTAGAADYFEVTGVQLEEGSTATAFRRNANSLQGELAACQRYYEKSYNIETAIGTSTQAGAAYVFGTSDAANMLVDCYFKVQKRNSSYSVATYSPSGTSGVWNCFRSSGNTTPTTVLNGVFYGTHKVGIYCATGAAWSPAILNGHWVVDNEL